MSIPPNPHVKNGETTFQRGNTLLKMKPFEIPVSSDLLQFSSQKKKICSLPIKRANNI